MFIRSLFAIILALINSPSFAASLNVSQYVYHYGLTDAAPSTSISDHFDQFSRPLYYSESHEYSTGPLRDWRGTIVEGHTRSSASFNLPRGEFKLYSESLFLEQQAAGGQLYSASYINFTDKLTVHSPTASTNYPAYLTIRLQSAGQISLLDNYGDGNTVEFDSLMVATNTEYPSISHAEGELVEYCENLDAPSCGWHGLPVVKPGSFASTSSDFMDGGKNEIMLRIPLYDETSEILLTVGLLAQTTRGFVDVSDASNASKLFIDIPGGSFTSELGLLTPIPEPDSYAMLLAGLFLIGMVVRHERRRGISRFITNLSTQSQHSLAQ